MNMNMAESEAVERLKCLRLYMEITDKNSENKFLEDDYIANKLAIKALENQEKIKEALEKWINDTGGFCYVDDETANLLVALGSILRSNEMSTLDELIAQECKIAEHNHNMYEFECMCYGKDTVDSEEKMECVKEYEYHSQIVELLEELKARREADRISDSKPFDVLLVQRYNKAIDDFTERLKAEYKPCDEKDTEIYKKVCNRIDKIAEQLKAGEYSEQNTDS